MSIGEYPLKKTLLLKNAWNEVGIILFLTQLNSNFQLLTQNFCSHIQSTVFSINMRFGGHRVYQALPCQETCTNPFRNFWIVLTKFPPFQSRNFWSHRDHLTSSQHESWFKLFALTYSETHPSTSNLIFKISPILHPYKTSLPNPNQKYANILIFFGCCDGNDGSVRRAHLARLSDYREPDVWRSKSRGRNSLPFWERSTSINLYGCRQTWNRTMESLM